MFFTIAKIIFFTALLATVVALGAAVRSVGKKASGKNKKNNNNSNPFLDRIKTISAKDSDLKRVCVRAGMRDDNAPLRVTLLRIFFTSLLMFVSLFYCFVIADDIDANKRLLIIAVFGAIGYLGPKMVVERMANARTVELERRFGDVLDLMLVCVSSGMSAEAAFKQVQNEMIGRSPPTADELRLLGAELSFLTERSKAYENLAERTQSKGYKSMGVTMVQSERYGTPLAQALRVLSQEHRTAYFQEIERKAMALPPKMTVPMMLFFLPVIFIVVLSPVIIKGLGLDTV